MAAAVNFHRCMSLTASIGWIGRASEIVGKSLCGVGKTIVIWNAFQEIVLFLYDGQRPDRQHLIEVLETAGLSAAFYALGVLLQDRQTQCLLNHYFS